MDKFCNVSGASDGPSEPCFSPSFRNMETPPSGILRKMTAISSFILDRRPPDRYNKEVGWEWPPLMRSVVRRSALFSIDLCVHGFLAAWRRLGATIFGGASFGSIGASFGEDRPHRNCNGRGAVCLSSARLGAALPGCGFCEASVDVGRPPAGRFMARHAAGRE